MLEIRTDIRYVRRDPEENGTYTYLIYDSLQESHYTLCERDYNVMGLISRNTVDDVLDLAEEAYQYTKNDVNHALQFLKSNRMFTASSELPFEKKGSLAKVFEFYFFKKFKVCQPDKFLSEIEGLLKFILNPIFITLITLLSLTGYLFLLKYWSQFSSHVVSNLSLSSLPYYFVAIIILKSFHEAGHAITAKVFGAKVHSMGVALVFMTPRLYTEVKNSLFCTKFQRILIPAAGMIAEFWIGGIMIILFCASSPESITAQLAAATVTLSLVSTVLFNGNFFMKFDGYYILSQALDCPNLYSRGQQEQKQFFHSLVWGIPPVIKESKWILLYGVMSFFYRIVLYTSIVIFLWLSSLKSLAVILCCLELTAFFIKPFLNEVKYFMKTKSNISYIRQAIVLVLFGALVCVGFYPIAHSKASPLYISSASYLDEVKASSSGFIKEVKENEIILENHEISFYKKDLEIEQQYGEMLTRYFFSKGLYGNHEESQINLSQISTRLEQVKKQTADLRIPYSGSLSNPESLKGKYVYDGMPISSLLVADQLYVAAFVSPEDIAEIKEGHIYLRHVDPILGKVIKKSKSPLLKTPPILANKIDSDKEGLPTQVLYEVSLKIDSNLINNKRTGVFVYQVKTAFIPYYYNIIVNFIKNELT
jgi:putative peptide zinc metalloprotease protein